MTKELALLAEVLHLREHLALVLAEPVGLGGGLDGRDATQRTRPPRW